MMAASARPKLLFFGDPHGAFAPIMDVVQRCRPEAIVLLGDLQPRQPLHLELSSILDRTHVWFIHGNHDTDSDEDFDHLFGSELAERNLHGRVQEIAGYRVAGLGGVFRQKIWDPAQLPSSAPFRWRDDLLRHARRGRATAHDGWRGGYARLALSSIPDLSGHGSEQRVWHSPFSERSVPPVAPRWRDGDLA